MKISDAIDVALYIFKVDPSHWSTFARISGFDRDYFETQLIAVVEDLLYVQHWCNNSDYSKRTGLTTIVEFETTLLGESIAAVKSKIQKCKKQRKPIVQLKSVYPYYFTWTTNVSEGLACGAIHSGVRFSSPPRLVNLMIATYEKQRTKLEKQYSTSIDNEHVLTLISENAMNTLRGQSSPDPESFTSVPDHSTRITTLK